MSKYVYLFELDSVRKTDEYKEVCLITVVLPETFARWSIRII